MTFLNRNQIIKKENFFDLKIKQKWNFYIHYSDDKNWDLDSYNHIIQINNLTQSILFEEQLSSKILQNCTHGIEYLFDARSGAPVTKTPPALPNGHSARTSAGSASPYPSAGDVADQGMTSGTDACGDAVGGKSLSHGEELGVDKKLKSTPHFEFDSVIFSSPSGD